MASAPTIPDNDRWCGIGQRNVPRLRQQSRRPWLKSSAARMRRTSIDRGRSDHPASGRNSELAIGWAERPPSSATAWPRFSWMACWSDEPSAEGSDQCRSRPSALADYVESVVM